MFQASAGLRRGAVRWICDGGGFQRRQQRQVTQASQAVAAISERPEGHFVCIYGARIRADSARGPWLSHEPIPGRTQSIRQEVRHHGQKLAWSTQLFLRSRAQTP